MGTCAQNHNILYSALQGGLVRLDLGAGMQDVDKQTSQVLLDFSYHLAIGDTSEAYKVLSHAPITLSSFMLAIWNHV